MSWLALPGMLAVALAIVIGLVVLGRSSQTRSAGFLASEYAPKPVLTAWELAALGEMRRELPGTLHVCPQVRLADLVKIRPSDPADRRAALNRVASKSVDFVVIDSAGQALLVVELDDRSHDREDRQERDRLVDAVLRHCAIPIRRVRPRQPVGALAALRLNHPALVLAA